MSGRELFAVALVQRLGGWLVEAVDAGEAKRIVHGTVPRAHECERTDLLAWRVLDYRRRYLLGADFGPQWIRLDPEDLERLIHESIARAAALGDAQEVARLSALVEQT